MHTRAEPQASPRQPRLVLAGADTPGEPETMVRKVQEYAQKATAMAKTAFSMVQESDAAQQARWPPALPLPPTPLPARASGPGSHSPSQSPP
uniref:Uncharacterized protein n=1 Tax=Accipiter nisus TaxID=211598 RepID=A0A8B9M7V4_9AVES